MLRAAASSTSSGMDFLLPCCWKLAQCLRSLPGLRASMPFSTGSMISEAEHLPQTRWDSQSLGLPEAAGPILMGQSPPLPTLRPEEPPVPAAGPQAMSPQHSTAPLPTQPPAWTPHSSPTYRTLLPLKSFASKYTDTHWVWRWYRCSPPTPTPSSLTPVPSSFALFPHQKLEAQTQAHSHWAQFACSMFPKSRELQPLQLTMRRPSLVLTHTSIHITSTNA